VTEGLPPEQVKMMKFTYSPNLEEAIRKTSEETPRADVAIFPSGGNMIPELNSKGV